MGGEYTDRSPLDYYYQGTDRAPIHPETKAKLLYVLEMLAEEGEEKTFRFIKEDWCSINGVWTGTSWRKRNRIVKNSGKQRIL